MHMHYTWGQLGPSFTYSKQHGSLGNGCGCSTLLRAFLSSRQTLSPLRMCVFSLKSFSFPKPKRGSHSYLYISKCSLSFPGQPPKSGLLYLKFKNLSSKYACTSLIMVCFCLFYFFFLFVTLLITAWISMPFPSSGNSFVILSLGTSGFWAVSWNCLFIGFDNIQVPNAKVSVCECADANERFWSSLLS